MSASHELLTPVREIHGQIRAAVLQSCDDRRLEEMAAVGYDGEGDTLYAIDRVSKSALVAHVERFARDVGGIVLIAERYDRLSNHRTPVNLSPSRARSIDHGYAGLARFFPGARDELAAIDEEIVAAVLGPLVAGKVLCFEDQYAATGGQLYELAAGHDRFCADLRPMMHRVLASRGQAMSICCHPYDVCTELIAREYGVIVTNPMGRPLDALLNVDANVAWAGYANREIRAVVEPVLQRALKRRGLIPDPRE